MSQICARAGGSKATLYGYFPSKENLFVECLFVHAETYLAGLLSDLQEPTDSPLPVLLAFGESYLRLISSPEMVALRRLMIAEAERRGIGKLFYAKLTRISYQLATFLQEVMGAEGLAAADAELAACQLRALLEAELLDPLLLSAGDGRPDAPTIALAAGRAVDTILRAYAPASR